MIRETCLAPSPAQADRALSEADADVRDAVRPRSGARSQAGPRDAQRTLPPAANRAPRRGLSGPRRSRGRRVMGQGVTDAATALLKAIRVLIGDAARFVPEELHSRA